MNAYENTKSETKKIKTLSEALIFTGIGLGYVIATWLIMMYPEWRVPYLVIIVGTIAVVILYYMRIYGIPIPGHPEIVIVDFSSDFRDVITKICQQILVIPCSMLLLMRSKS